MLPFPYDWNSNILFLTCVTACITRLNYVQSINMSPYPIHLNIIVPIIDPPYAGTCIFFQNIRKGWNPTWASTMSTLQHLALADLSWSILTPEKCYTLTDLCWSKHIPTVWNTWPCYHTNLYKSCCTLETLLSCWICVKCRKCCPYPILTASDYCIFSVHHPYFITLSD